ncbi:MAG: hypothetical protein Q8L88_11295 [Bacteroidota bacterium]|nr:hypothetical protein [Bacteroidota bacterium]
MSCQRTLASISLDSGAEGINSLTFAGMTYSKIKDLKCIQNS